MSRRQFRTAILNDIAIKISELKYSVHPRVEHLVPDDWHKYMREYNEAIDQIILRIEVNDL